MSLFSILVLCATHSFAVATTEIAQAQCLLSFVLLGKTLCDFAAAICKVLWRIVLFQIWGINSFETIDLGNWLYTDNSLGVYE